MLAIQTHFIGPTNRRNARYVASVMEPARTSDGLIRRKLTLETDDRLSSEDNHKRVARQLIIKLGWTIANGYGPWIMGGCEPGYVFVNDTRLGVDRLEIVSDDQRLDAK